MINKIKLIDSHHHYWDLKNIKKYPLFTNLNSNSHLGDYQKIVKNYLPLDLKKNYQKFNLVSSVHIEAGWIEKNAIEEVEWLNKINSQSEKNLAVIAFAKLHNSNLDKYLDKLIKYDFVKGIRMRLANNINELKEGDNYLINSKWLQGFNILNKYKYSFELQGSYKISHDIYNFLNNNEDTKIIISHAGFPNYKNEEEKKAWINFLKRIQYFENVYLKISGLAMLQNGLNINKMDYIIKSCMNIFGSEKLIFGSNLPIDSLYCDTQNLLDAYFDIFKKLGKENLDKIVFKNAKKFYNF